MGWKNLAGAAAVGGQAGGSGGGAPSWLLWAFLILRGGALLLYGAAWLLRRIEGLQEGSAARRRQKSYEEAKRLGKQD